MKSLIMLIVILVVWTIIIFFISFKIQLFTNIDKILDPNLFIFVAISLSIVNIIIVTRMMSKKFISSKLALFVSSLTSIIFFFIMYFITCRYLSIEKIIFINYSKIDLIGLHNLRIYIVDNLIFFSTTGLLWGGEKIFLTETDYSLIHFIRLKLACIFIIMNNQSSNKNIKKYAQIFSRDIEIVLRIFEKNSDNEIFRINKKKLEEIEKNKNLIKDLCDFYKHFAKNEISDFSEFKLFLLKDKKRKSITNYLSSYKIILGA